MQAICIFGRRIFRGRVAGEIVHLKRDDTFWRPFSKFPVVYFNFCL